MLCRDHQRPSKLSFIHSPWALKVPQEPNPRRLLLLMGVDGTGISGRLRTTTARGPCIFEYKSTLGLRSLRLAFGHLVNVATVARLSAPRSIQIPRACAEGTCARRFSSSSCTGISSRPSGSASGLGGWTGRRTRDCSGGTRRVSHLPTQRERHVSARLRRANIITDLNA